eukprot:m.138289 g.138289  ORF g.138289 m.138289 type:complete len:221 (+) comp14010_c0_seq2:2178-2840(+)
MDAMTYEVFRSLVDTDPIPHVVINHLPEGVEMPPLPETTKVCKLEEFKDDMVPVDGCVAIVVQKPEDKPALESQHPVMFFSIDVQPDPEFKEPESFSCDTILKSDGSLFVLDIRRYDEVQNFGALPHSLNIPLHDLLRELNEGAHSENLRTILTTDKPIVTCCRTQRRAGFTARLLNSIGLKDVHYVFKGACGCAEEPESGMLCYPSYEVGEELPKSCHA